MQILSATSYETYPVQRFLGSTFHQHRIACPQVLHRPAKNIENEKQLQSVRQVNYTTSNNQSMIS